MKDKSYKREAASLFMAYVLLMFAWGAFGNPVAVDIGKYLTLPAVGMFAGAYGLHSYLVQYKGPSK